MSATLSAPPLTGQARAAPLADQARAVGLRVRAAATWPDSASIEDVLPALPGFIESSFSPLVAEVAERCLRRGFPTPSCDTGRGARTAVILASRLGDITSAVKVARAVAAGARVGPLLFFQSVPNAVGGYIAARWGLAGPMVSLGSARAAVEVAALLLDDGDADSALIVFAEQSWLEGVGDRAEAVLVSPGPAVPAGSDVPTARGEPAP